MSQETTPREMLEKIKLQIEKMEKIPNLPELEHEILDLLKAVLKYNQDLGNI